MRTAGLLLGLAVAALLGFLVVDAEAATRRAGFRIVQLSRRAADCENENVWLRNRIEARRRRLDVPAAMKRAGLDLAAVPVRRIAPPVPPPALRRPGS